MGEEGGGGLYLSLQIYKTLFLIKWFIMMYIYIYMQEKVIQSLYILNLTVSKLEVVYAYYP